MAPKKPTVKTKLQQKADKSNKILTGPKGSKPQSTTNARLMKQGDKTTTSGPARTRFQNPSRGGSTTKSQTVGGGGKNLFGGAGDKNTAVKQGGPSAPKPAFSTSRAPFSRTGPTRASIGNVKGPASSAQRPTGPVRASIGNVKGPATSPKAPSVAKGAAKGASALSKAGRFVGRTSAVLTGAELFQQGKSGSELDQLTRAIGGKGSNPNTDIGKRASDAIAAAFTQKSKYGPRFKKSGSQPAAKPAAKPAMPALKGSMVNGKIQMTQVAKPKKPIAKPVAPKAATTPARSSALGRSSAPARTPTSRPAAKPAAKPKAPASMATESSMSASDIMKGYGMRVNQTFSAESPSTSKKRQSLKDQTAEIKKMIEESKKRQGKG